MHLYLSFFFRPSRLHGKYTDACTFTKLIYQYHQVKRERERKKKRTDAFFSSKNLTNPHLTSPALEGNVNLGKEISMLLTDKASSPPSPTLFSLAPSQQPALRAYVDAPVSHAQVMTRPQTPTPCAREALKVIEGLPPR